MRISAKVTTRGGIFKPSGIAAVGRAEMRVEDTTAAEGVSMVRSRLRSVLQNPTGYYSSQIRARRDTIGTAEVTDSGVIYGPWLEGVSSRNQTTRFKGYATFRRTKQELAGKVPGIVKGDIATLVRDLN
jgi:hypothetical protein